MGSDIDLKAIERKAWKLWFDDGLLDILWGLMLLQMFLGQLLEMVGVPRPLNYLPIMTVAVVGMIAGKLLVTRPRLGRVKFSAQRNLRRGLAKLVAALTFSGTLLLLIGITTKSCTSADFALLGPETGSLFLLLLIVLVPLVLVAWLVDFWRLAFYGVLLIAADMVGETLKTVLDKPWDTFYAFSLPGTVILIYGIVLLIKFLRRYPRESVDGSADAQS